MKHDLRIEQDILIFFEDLDRDTFVAGDRRIRNYLRKLYRKHVLRKQDVTGFEMSFRRLCRALREAGRTVHVNAYSLAKKNPLYPIGICGYPHILKNWKLPNPALLGPGLYDHPKINLQLFDDERFRGYIVRAPWFRTMFAKYYPDKLLHDWLAGMDLNEWPDCSANAKSIDFIIYDKVRWDRETLVDTLINPIFAELKSRGLSYKQLVYSQHTQAEFKGALRDARALIFLCEHETQGNAYQEAMACNLPVIAWDQGYWLDPNRPKWESEPIPASSVPNFSQECGERFTNANDFSDALNRYIERKGTYKPRQWVSENVSFAKSAQLYLDAYAAVYKSAKRD